MQVGAVHVAGVPRRQQHQPAQQHEERPGRRHRLGGSSPREEGRLAGCDLRSRTCSCFNRVHRWLFPSVHSIEPADQSDERLASHEHRRGDTLHTSHARTLGLRKGFFHSCRPSSPSPRLRAALAGWLARASPRASAPAAAHSAPATAALEAAYGSSGRTREFGKVLRGGLVHRLIGDGAAEGHGAAA